MIIFQYLKLIRVKNLALLAIMQLVIRYGFLSHQTEYLALSHFQYLLLVLATLLIAAAGYVINDIFDQETNLINKPEKVIVGKHISESAAYNYYVALNIIGVCIGFYLSNVIEKPSFSTLFILIAASLYFYATNLKHIILVGNVLVAIQLALSVLIIGVFDLFPATYNGNQEQMSILFGILLDYALFVFIISLIREIIKDVEGNKGDYSQGYKTLPIVLGVKRTIKLVFGLSIIPFLLVLYYCYNYLMENQLYYAVFYVIFLVLAPMLYFTINCWNSKTKKDFTHLSSILKLILFFGVTSIAAISYNIKLNA